MKDTLKGKCLLHKGANSFHEENPAKFFFRGSVTIHLKQKTQFFVVVVVVVAIDLK